PAFADNYIWTLIADDGTAVVIDPGDAAPVLALADQGLRVDPMLLPHHHDDHIGGVPALQARFPGVRVIAPVEERI
ncbi:MBL fold metallo-hydrolase, partial [Acinetobacter baumannii]